MWELGLVIGLVVAFRMGYKLMEVATIDSAIEKFIEDSQKHFKEEVNIIMLSRG